MALNSAEPRAVRRVVTGHAADGRAIFVGDDLVPARTTPAFALHILWGFDEPPQLPNTGARPDTDGYFPPLGGSRFVIATLPPDADVRRDLDEEVAAAAIEAAFPGMLRFHEDATSGMHTTPTVDFEVVLSGECVLELDDGASVRLGPGDTVVQNGTRHRWSNPTDEPCVFAVFLTGAARLSVDISNVDNMREDNNA